MFRSIRWRVAVPYVLLLSVYTLIIGFYWTRFLRQSFLQETESQLFAHARLISDVLRPELLSETDSEVLQVQVRRWDELIGRRITVIGTDGTVLAESRKDQLLLVNHLARPEVQQALTSGQGSAIRFSETLGESMMYAALPVVSDSKIIAVLRISASIQSINQDINQTQQTMLVIALVISLAGIVMAFWIANQSTQSLRYLVDYMQNKATRIPELNHSLFPMDEVDQLARTYNTMASQLQLQIETLKKEGSKLAAVLKHMSDGVIIADYQGLITLLNPAAERLFGIHEEKALGRSLAEVVRHYQLVEMWQHCRQTGEEQEITLELNLQRTAIQGIATPLGQSLPGSTLLLFQDITRLRQLETVRRDFISNLSHELRTPLASLKALTETLQDTALDDPPAARQFLQSIETEVDSLSLMVSELLELSRIESGKVPLRLTLTHPKTILDSAVERLRLQAERAGLTLNLHYSEHLPEILVDPPRIEQVVVNLLHNAIKFTPTGGEIWVSAFVEGDPAHISEVIFQIRDTGVGISTNDLKRIFERFFKADRARSGGGTGLGLAIARHMIEAHQGKIWVESTEGQGSTFTFSIPVFTE